MLGLIYLLNCIFLGFAIISDIFQWNGSRELYTFKKKKIGVSSFFFLFPLWFVTGTLIDTWAVYILACLFHKMQNPLLAANIIVMPLSLVVALFLLYGKFRRAAGELKQSLKRIRTAEVIAFALILALFLFLFFRTLYFEDGKLHVGLTVFSDFSTHLSMVRSFSQGHNFPTQYTFFAGQDVKYHFMFQFLCGNLEYLGMRIDMAMNIPSLLSILSAYMALYVLAVKITGRRAVGYVSMLLLTFRSSFSLFIFAGEQPKGEVLKNLVERAEFIGSTNHEDWGLWNLNVYCNQRHLAFSLTVAVLVLILMLPPVFESFKRLYVCRLERRRSELAERIERTENIEADESKNRLTFADRLYADVWTILSDSLLNRMGWLPSDMKTAVFSGLILGLSGFWNGAVFLAVIMVLFFLAVISDRRLEFLAMATIAGALSLIQSKIFVAGSLFSPEIMYGFLSENRTFASSLIFMIKLTGLLIPVLLIAFAMAKGHYKYLMFCFSIPIIFAFTISLTPDIAVNHKYIMFAIMLLDIPAADFLTELFAKKNVWVKLLTVICIFVMTVTGIYEFEIMCRMDCKERSFSYAEEDKLTEWVWENADENDIFLTANYYLSSQGAGSSLILSGCKLFNGWQYFSWSAGYDTAGRDKIAAGIYSSENRSELLENVKDSGIRYIVVAFSNRISEDYELNEDTIAKTFGKVYSEGEGEYMTTIYDTGIILSE